MNSPFPKAPLRSLLRRAEEPVVIQPTETYKQVTVRLLHKGVVLRRQQLGAEIRTARQWRVRAGQVLLSRIDARNGAIGRVPPELDGAIVTNDFWSFDVDADAAEPRFLVAYFGTGEFVEACKRASEGTTNRVRLQPERFLDTEVPLPPLPEQRRIVARIEELAAKIEQVRTLRRQAAEEVGALFAAGSDAAFRPRVGWKEARVGEICEPPQYGFTASATNDPVGPRLLRITDIQDGHVNWDTVPFCQCPNPEQYLLQKGDLVFARTGATTGKSFLIGDCPTAIFASYLIRLRVKSLVRVEYLYHYFRTPLYWSQISEEKTGTGQPNVNGKKLAVIRVPIPPVDEQSRIVAHLDGLRGSVEALKGLQEETASEVDALLPSILDKAFKGDLR